MLEMPIWFEYAIYDDDGVCGVRDDAPKKVKEAYAKYEKQQKEAEEEGLKL